MPPINAHNFITFNQTEYDDGFSSRGFHPVHNEIQQQDSFSYPAFSRPDAAPQYGRHYQTLGGPHSNNRFNKTIDHDMDMYDNDMDAFYLNDPLVNLSLKPSYDNLDSPPPGKTAGCTSTMTKMNVETFSSHLDTLHNRLRGMINDAPSGEQGAMVSTFASWAQNVAKQPLEHPNAASVFRNAKKTPAVLATKQAKAAASTEKA